MRFRILLMLVLASVLGTPVLLHYQRAQAACASIPDPRTCAAVAPSPLWARPLGLLSAFALASGLYLFAQASTARRNERNLLHAVGVDVREEDLPLEE